MPRGGVIRGRSLWMTALVAVLSVAAACSPAPAPTSPGSAPSAPVRQPSLLTIASQRGVGTFSPFGERPLGAGFAVAIVYDTLTYPNQGVFEGLLAEQISTAKGTWRINGDGSMDTTWRLRPNVKWHDGTPFTSDDLVFSFTVYKDREMGTSFLGQMRAMESVSAPDPLTFEVHWSSLDIKADQAPGMIPLPRHLLEETYLTNKQNLSNLPYFTREFIGLGPFKLVGWEAGVESEFVRFDDYYRGAAPIDRIILRTIHDPAAMVASILAGAVDVVVPPGPDVEAAAAVKERWAGTGNHVLVQVTDSVNGPYILQQRPELARPRNGLTNRDVREALYRAIDRPAMSEALTYGLAPVADSWVAPFHGMRRDVEASIPQFPFDLRRAQQLMERAGWVRGSDGILVHQVTGDRFEIQLSGMDRAIVRQQEAIIGQEWSALGADVDLDIIPAARAQDAKTLSTVPGAFLGRTPAQRYYFDRKLHTEQITGEHNRWAGWNQSAYSNPEVDRLLDRLSASIDPGERATITRQVLQASMGDVAFWPLFWEVEPFFALASVRVSEGRTDSQYVYEWQKL